MSSRLFISIYIAGALQSPRAMIVRDVLVPLLILLGLTILVLQSIVGG